MKLIEKQIYGFLSWKPVDERLQKIRVLSIQLLEKKLLYKATRDTEMRLAISLDGKRNAKNLTDAIESYKQSVIKGHEKDAFYCMVADCLIC